jgi:hypothetical protein
MSSFETAQAANPQDNDASSNTGRDERGRFRKGNPGGPGNPFARKVAALRQALFDSVTMEEMIALNKVIYARALQGDMAAARLIYVYILGKPVPTEDPDRLEEKEWQQHVRERVKPEELTPVFTGMSVALANELLKTIFPPVEAAGVQFFKEGLAAMQQEEERRKIEQLQEQQEERPEEVEEMPCPQEHLPQEQVPVKEEATSPGQLEHTWMGVGDPGLLATLLQDIRRAANQAGHFPSPSSGPPIANGYRPPRGRTPAADG